MPSTSTSRIPDHQAKPDFTVRQIPASSLTDHPLLAHIPTWTREEPEFQALLESIRDHGLDYEVLIDSEGRVVDGRNRRNALAVLKQPVRCRQISDGEAASVIVASLVNRRHLSKGALAYLSAPLFSDVLEESKARNIAMLKAGTARLEGTVAHSVGHGPKSTADIAATVGVGPTLFDQALKLRRMLTELGEEVRAKYEPRVLGPWLDEAGEWQDPIGLGFMINGLTSLINDAAGRKKKLGKRAEHARLFLGFLPKLKEHWRRATAEQKAEIAEKLKAEVTKFPAELREEIAAALRAAARADRE